MKIFTFTSIFFKIIIIVEPYFIEEKDLTVYAKLIRDFRDELKFKDLFILYEDRYNSGKIYSTQ